MSKLVKKIIITTQMTLKTGLRIGGSKESIEIGGLDSPVIRRAFDSQPYIPGSSLKGKIRSLLELCHDDNLKKIQRENTGSWICFLFGASEGTFFTEQGNKTEGAKSKIIFRDAYLTKKSEEKLRSIETDMPYTEIKTENVIDRIKGTAEHPRQLERIPAKAVFDIEIVINVHEGDNETVFMNLLENGLKLLQEDYLGGSGSRGYGQVEFGINEKDGEAKAVKIFFQKREILAEHYIVKS